MIRDSYIPQFLLAESNLTTRPSEISLWSAKIAIKILVFFWGGGFLPASSFYFFNWGFGGSLLVVRRLTIILSSQSSQISR